MGSTFIRSKKDSDNPYVIINKKALNDTRLSLKAKGLMAILLSLPDDWEIYETELVKRSADGKSSLNSGIKELMKFGYLERTVKRNKKGQFKGYKYVVYESLPETRFSDIGKPEVGKLDTTNNNSTNNNYIYSASKDAHLEFFEEVWKLYPNKRGKAKVSNSKKKEIFKLADEFKRCIERYKLDVKKQRENGFPELKFQIGSTFFNSGYVDYLDENYKETMKVSNTKEDLSQNNGERLKRYETY